MAPRDEMRIVLLEKKTLYRWASIAQRVDGQAPSHGGQGCEGGALLPGDGRPGHGKANCACRELQM